MRYTRDGSPFTSPQPPSERGQRDVSRGEAHIERFIPYRNHSVCLNDRAMICTKPSGGPLCPPLLHVEACLPAYTPGQTGWPQSGCGKTTLFNVI